jgi:membrane protein CcdC involved in cytochrome C biogenesis
MKLGTIVKASFIVSFLLTLIGAYLKILHSNEAETFLIIGLVASLIFIVTAIYEVRTSKRIDHRQKTLWTIGFILLSGVTGLLYIFIGRKNVAAT